MIYDVVIIGAGASGLAAAYRMADAKKKLNILVLEKGTVPGRKLSAAGNGKCNLTNRDFRFDCYHSDDMAFMEEWVSRHTYREVIDFFEELGVLLYENNGYYYPLSNQGKQVTKFLYEKSRQMGAAFLFGTRASAIYMEGDKKQPLYRIEAYTMNQQPPDGIKSYANHHQPSGRIKPDIKDYSSLDRNEDSSNKRKPLLFFGKNIILAAGGLAAPQLGGSRDAYWLAEKLHLRQRPCYPVLSPIYVEDKALSLAKGVRLDAVVTLKGGDGSIRERGQIQFNEKNLSGIVIMNLSCYLNRWGKGSSDCLQIDTIPDLSWNALKEFILSQRKSMPQESILLMLCGILPESFVKYILKRLQIDKGQKVSELTEKQINKLTSTLKKLCYTPVMHEDYDKAQVTGGGILTDEVDNHSFECKKYKNLYLTGEMLDINGKCGGYNLTFAILSGIQAAEHIINNRKEL